MEKITSLNSPHIERVKALLGSRGKKTRDRGLDIVEVSEQVMNAMADSQTPQGILALCSTKSLKLSDLWKLEPKKIAFFWQIQDPGNAGTVIRTADACGFDAVIFSEESVDIFNPKTVRASVGSLWHIPVIPNVKIDEFIDICLSRNAQIYALSANGSQTLDSEFVTKTVKDPSIWIFGNEARGLPELPQEVKTVSIPMKGFAESLNVASAAAIVLHSVGLSL